jgi:hypothetical protein
MSAANGATNKDPALREIVIRFDRPMSNSGAFATVGSLPQDRKARFDDTGTTFTMAVTLEPAHEYQLIVNLPDGNFRARDGGLLKPVQVHFATAQAR